LLTSNVGVDDTERSGRPNEVVTPEENPQNRLNDRKVKLPELDIKRTCWLYIA